MIHSKNDKMGQMWVNQNDIPLKWSNGTDVSNPKRQPLKKGPLWVNRKGALYKSDRCE